MKPAKPFALLLLLIGLPVAGRSAVGLAQGRPFAATTTDPALLMIPKNGTVLNSTTTTAIFWGSEWLDPTFAGDVISGLDAFYDGFGGSHYAGIATEYYDRSGRITSFSTYRGHAIDPSEPPSGVVSATDLVGEACRITRNNPDPDGVYFIYLSNPTSSTGACPGHTWGYCQRNKPIQVAFGYHTTGELDDPCGGEVQDNGTVTGHSLSLGQFGKVTANQLMNTITDPRGDGWLDALGAGIGGKCRLTLPPDGTYETFSNGSLWKLQTTWSNNAYRAGTGLLNQLNQPGCVY
jgi:hypothetical protein